MHISSIEMIAPARNSSCFTILVADDDIDDRQLFEEALSMLHLDVKLVMVQDGEQLMEYLRRSSLPNIVFLDLNMPLKNGHQSLIEIKADARLASLPVMILSTSTNEARKAQLIEEGARAYFSKPVKFSQLIQLLDEALHLVYTGIPEAAGVM